MPELLNDIQNVSGWQAAPTVVIVEPGPGIFLCCFSAST